MEMCDIFCGWGDALGANFKTSDKQVSILEIILFHIPLVFF